MKKWQSVSSKGRLTNIHVPASLVEKVTNYKKHKFSSSDMIRQSGKEMCFVFNIISCQLL